MNIDKKIIEVEYGDVHYEHFDERDLGIKFWNDSVDVDEFFDFIIQLNEYFLGLKLTEYEIVDKIIEAGIYTFEELWTFYQEDRDYLIGIHRIEEYDDSIEKFWKRNKTFSTSEQMFYSMKKLEKLSAFDNAEIMAELFNCHFGCGQNAWFLAWEDIPDSFIKDFMGGHNWYSLLLLNPKTGKIEDAIAGIYAPEDEDLENEIVNNFGLERDEYYLLENEISRYYNFPKVKETSDGYEVV